MLSVGCLLISGQILNKWLLFNMSRRKHILFAAVFVFRIIYAGDIDL